MGVIKTIASAVGGSLADQWLEVIEPDDMSDTTVFTKGISVRKNDPEKWKPEGDTGRYFQWIGSPCISEPVYDVSGRREGSRFYGRRGVLYGEQFHRPLHVQRLLWGIPCGKPSSVSSLEA